MDVFVSLKGVQVINGVPIAIPESDGWEIISTLRADNWFNSTSKLYEKGGMAFGERFYYTLCTTMIKLLVVNHLVSAFDAYLSAKWYNNGISSSVGMRTINSGNVVTLVPSLRC